MKKRTLLISAGLGVGLVVAGVYGVRWWIRAMNTVSTDDARVTASYATISAEVSGRIVKFPVDEGDVVQKGTLLLRIDHENYKAALEESVAERAQATAQLSQERIQLKAMEATVRGEISRAEATVGTARSILREKERMVELARLVTKTQRDQVAAALKVVQSSLAAGEVELKNAAVELERAKKLFKSEFISAKDLDTAKTAYDHALATVEMRKNEVQWAKADIGLAQVSKLNNFRDDAMLAQAKTETARSDLKKAEADLQLAKAHLADLEAYKARIRSHESRVDQLDLQIATKRRLLAGTEVRSPVNGIVVRQTADLGDIIESGQPLIKVAIEGTLEVRANIGETYLRYIQRGNPVEVYVDAYPNRSIIGKVKIIGDATDSEFALFRPSGPFTKIEQVIPVEISLDGHSNNRDLKPGMNVIVYITRTGSNYGGSSMKALAKQRSP